MVRCRDVFYSQDGIGVWPSWPLSGVELSDHAHASFAFFSGNWGIDPVPAPSPCLVCFAMVSCIKKQEIVASIKS